MTTKPQLSESRSKAPASASHTYWRSMRAKVSVNVIHRDDCVRMTNAARWDYADVATERELFADIYLAPWLKGCRTCMPEVTWE